MATNRFGYWIYIEVDGKLVYFKEATMFKDLAMERMQKVVEEFKSKGIHGVADIRSGRSGKSCGHVEF